MGRKCCDAKRGTGKCLVYFFTIIFGLGVAISTLSPNWIQFEASDPRVVPTETHIVEWGPFYGQSRTCTQSDDGQSATCSKWTQATVDLSDCNVLDDYSDVAPYGYHISKEDQEKLCRHLATFRSTGMICLILVFIGGCLIFAATFCQVVTCGCCGNSLTCIANLLFWVQVVTSIVCWSFAISSLKQIDTIQGVTSSAYQWGFWLFIFSGTVFGAMAAWMADWAAEDSCLRGAWHCMTCCFRKDESENERNDNTTPLIGENSA